MTGPGHRTEPATGARPGRILVLTSSFPLSDSDSRNAGVFVVDLARLLGEAGHEVTILSPQRSSVTGPFSVLSFPRIGDEPSLSHLDPRTPRGLLKLLSVIVGGVVTVPWVTRRRNVDHVLALWAVPSGLLALVARIFTRTPYSVWALGSDIWRIRDYPGGTPLLRLVLRRAVRTYADGVGLAADTSAISDWPCDFLATSRTLPAPTQRLWSDGRRHLVAIARFHEHKGMDVLVEAISALPETVREDLTVHLYGDGPMKDAMVELTRSRALTSVVRFEGFADEQHVSDVLHSADLAVVPSRVESIPLVLSDIAGAGAPMVVTDAGDMGDLVNRFGAGRVATAGDAESLSREIAAALTGSGVGSEQGRRDLAEHLSLERSVGRILDDLGLSDPQ